MELLGQVGSFFGSPAGKGLETVAGLGATGAGLAGNLAADRQRSQAAAAAKANMNLTPQQLGAEVKSATQPLNQGLVQAITGNVNANLAEQGLSQAPGIQATALAQALSPFQQQNQQTALQLVMQKLGLPGEFARTIPPNADLAPLLAMLFKGGFPSTPTAPKPGGFQTTGPTLDQAGITESGSPTTDLTLGDWGNLFPTTASNA